MCGLGGTELNTERFRFPPERLRSFAASLLRGCGLPETDAATVAEAVVQSDLDGVETHGLARLPNYLERLRRGAVNPRPQIRPLRSRGATLLLDGDNGMGQVTASHAMRAAISLAREYGIGWVGLCRSGHLGAASYYCQMAVEAGMIGVALSNSPAAMAPWGGRVPFLGTNPIAIGVPAGEHAPFVVDLATSTAARGHLLKAEREGRPIPLNWAVDAEGHPTTDPSAALGGALLPMAGPKGYGLALAVEVFAAVLTGAQLSPEIPSFFTNFTDESNVGHTLVAVDITAFMEPDQFSARMEGLLTELQTVPPAAGFERLLYPGQRRALTRARREAEGLELAPALVDQLDRFAAELGQPPLRAEYPAS